MVANDVWELVGMPEGCRPLHTNWVFKTKTDANGDVERYKARLVACGNEQRFGIGYSGTFAAVMEMDTVKVILALARKWRTRAKHGDIPNSYVKALSEEEHEIFLFVPQGMLLDAELLKVLGLSSARELALHLRKTLYGLKQAGRLWNKLLHSKFIELAFTQCMTDMCLYVKYVGDNVVVVSIYVDDLLVTGTCDAIVDQFFEDMKTLEIKALGYVSKFLGMRVDYTDSDGYVVDQEVTIDGMLQEHGLGDANAVRTRIGDECNEIVGTDAALLPAKAAKGQPTIRDFQSLVGSLLWIARYTRPDIALPYTRQLDKRMRLELSIGSLPRRWRDI